jgi:hypothetical protein
VVVVVSGSEVVVEVDEVAAGGAAQADAIAPTARVAASTLMSSFQRMVHKTLPAGSTNENIDPEQLDL